MGFHADKDPGYTLRQTKDLSLYRTTNSYVDRSLIKNNNQILKMRPSAAERDPVLKALRFCEV